MMLTGSVEAAQTFSIKAGSMSSYFLVPEGRGRAIRVRMADR